ncbi:hypothetical protein HQ560_14955 [bacterium]|nr:hypothetical protein [bacterium]
MVPKGDGKYQTLTGVQVPSQHPGRARAEASNGRLRLENDVLSMSWDAAGGKLQPLSITDRLHGKTWRQDGCDMFHIGTGETPVEVAYDDLHIGMRIRANGIDVMVSRDGKSWRSVYQHEVAGRATLPAVVRVGKMDMKGGLTDYGSRGEDGICRFSRFRIHGDQGVILSAEDFKAPLDKNVWRVHLSAKGGTAATVRDGYLRIATGANCATCVERSLPEQTRFVSCRVAKGTDSGMSWGPGLAVVWGDGEFVVCGIRDARQVNVHTKAGERFLGIKRHNPTRLDLSASQFTIAGKPQVADISEIRAGVKRTGRSIRVALTNEGLGIAATWRGVLWDGAHYIRQEFSFTAASADVPVNGLDLLHCRIGDAAQVGSVIGSPAATDAMFAGVELPVSANSVGGLGDLRCGFACKLRFTAKRPYRFSTVLGVYAAGQLRRTFLSYIEAERARPSRPFMHYNCWYDLGYNISGAGIIDAAKQFHKHLCKPFGLKMESYALDDGWDDFHRGLWVTNLKRFPGGFGALSKELAKLDSKMGIWISPMGGYGGDKLRTALARKMGLITGDRLDLAEDAYYRWYRDKCRSLMTDDGVNYFKWDRAGSGASPHFMALLNIARELREVNADVFINVTAGTWPSPFWLNHIDCTWRGEGGDVGWIGKGDDREQWLTFRDQFCYSGVVRRAPIYPLNSLMHHGLVHGRAFQGHRVSKAGSDLKNEARSYFGAGPTLQELYITPSMMTEASWRQVGEAAQWAHANADVLLDTHWVGGEPKTLKPYGYASWSPRKGTLTLRNPDDAPQPFVLDIQKVFELPAEAPRTYRLKNAYPDQTSPEPVLTAGTMYTVKLRPFEVLVFDLEPLRE